MMQERFVTSPEAVAIFLNQRRWHRRIPEPRMLLHTRRLTLRDIASCSFESSVETLPARVAKFRRRRWRRINNHRLRMRAPSQRDGQQQSSKCKPFLHIVPRLLICGVPPDSRAGAFSFKPQIAKSVAIPRQFNFSAGCEV